MTAYGCQRNDHFQSQYTAQVSLNYYTEISEQLYGETEVSEIAYWNLTLGEFCRLHVRLLLKCICVYAPTLLCPSVYSLP